MGKVVLEQPVHTFHIDINRHVSNIVYLQWLETGRIRLFEAIGLPVESLQERGIHAVLLETWIKHHRPLHYPDDVRIEVWVSEVTHASAYIEFEIHSVKHAYLAARARQRGVFADAETNRPLRLTADMRAAFARAVAPTPPSGRA